MERVKCTSKWLKYTLASDTARAPTREGTTQVGWEPRGMTQLFTLLIDKQG